MAISPSFLCVMCLPQPELGIHPEEEEFESAHMEIIKITTFLNTAKIFMPGFLNFSYHIRLSGARFTDFILDSVGCVCVCVCPDVIV